MRPRTIPTQLHNAADGHAVAGAPATSTPADAAPIVLRNVMVPMRDGVLLATDIYLPRQSRDGVQSPVILERTPYGKHLPSRSERSASNAETLTREQVASYFVQHGYAVVYQDCRGRYASEGEFVKYTSDAEDGYDTCAWIVRQDWSAGRIGTMGLSYAAHTQAALASLGAPGVVAMFMDSGGFSNAYQGGIRQGGAFEMKQATWALRQALESPEVLRDEARADALRDVDMREWFERSLEWTPGNSPLQLAPEYEQYLFEQWRHGKFDAYWRRPGLYAQGYHDRFCDAAMVHMSSWFDPYPRTATENYMGLVGKKKNPVNLILGPWTHGNRSLTYAGDVDFGPEATLDGQLAPDFLALRLAWFERWLKGNPELPSPLPPVSLFVMGGGSGRRNAQGRMEHGGTWRAEPSWPVPGTQLQSHYLHADGLLATDQPAATEAHLAYRYDPHHPVPTVGGAVTSGEPLMVGGAFDQHEHAARFGVRPPYEALAARADVLVFQSPVLQEDVEVTGAVSAELWISSDCVDTDFTIKLIDVYPPNEDYPDGYAMNLTDGILRVRYRDSWEQPALMTPGQVYRIRIDAFPTSNLFKAGHRIRVDVSSSNFPRFDCNPNTGADEGVASEPRVAANRIYVDAQRPSHVILPVVSR
ncbi:CocE/NonD family hydrolase [Herbaspirillum sp. YR522]|uniref:CocE/NonD family hydrolase n=1 Tax=Herbaspirillum sp. YR522 TaxID=1144342 RepID=UPI00026F912E|nr:CocE/NonD family hydrolase [Herbaspirillum sp. YR522]EJN02915.1 putative hydrolase, CocE/NonD family [Herbaspirillum sp. YR522]